MSMMMRFWFMATFAPPAAPRARRQCVMLLHSMLGWFELISNGYTDYGLADYGLRASCESDKHLAVS
eukprot:5854217-Lingulodinium_polyedra.AAC.1